MVNVKVSMRMDDSSTPQLPVMSLISRSAISTFFCAVRAGFVEDLVAALQAAEVVEREVRGL